VTIIQTTRLELRSLSAEELRLLADDAGQLGRTLDVQIATDMLTNATAEAIHAKLGKLASTEPQTHDWITYWLIITRDIRDGVGLVGFEGSPNSQGEVEISYVMDTDHRQMGYMSEGVRQLSDWAFEHEHCTAITAQHVLKSNKASNRLLQNIGAQVQETTDELRSYRLDRGDWQHGVTDHYQPHRREREHKSGDMGQRWEITAALSDGPKSRKELVDHLLSYVRFLGLFSLADRLSRPQRQAEFFDVVDSSLKTMLQDGWVVRAGTRYQLTDLGKAESARPLADLQRTGEILRRAAQPTTAAIVSLGLHLCLAAIKIPVGMISGSVGLLNDGLDTLGDGLSSLLVLLGLRNNRERAANVALVVLMLITAGMTLFEATRRLFSPPETTADLLAFGAAILSALLYGLLSLYQRAVGQRAGSMSLITQAIDSRNHVIVAASVTAGLIAALSSLYFVDAIVGLAVALLILKSAVELVIELIHSLSGEESDQGERKDLLARLERYRRDQLADWMLYLVQSEQIANLADLSQRATEALDMSDNPSLRALGLGQSEEGASARVGEALDLIRTNAWLRTEPALDLTSAGESHLRQARTHHTHRHEDLQARWSTHRSLDSARPGRGLGRDGVGPGRGRRRHTHDDD